MKGYAESVSYRKQADKAREQAEKNSGRLSEETK